MIVKVQSPLSDPNAMWLVYAEGKTHVTLVDRGRVPQDVQDAVTKGNGRAFFEATIAKRQVTWGAQAEDQTW